MLVFSAITGLDAFCGGAIRQLGNNKKSEQIDVENEKNDWKRHNRMKQKEKETNCRSGEVGSCSPEERVSHSHTQAHTHTQVCSPVTHTDTKRTHVQLVGHLCMCRCVCVCIISFISDLLKE